MKVYVFDREFKSERARITIEKVSQMIRNLGGLGNKFYYNYSSGIELNITPFAIKNVIYNNDSCSYSWDGIALKDLFYENESSKDFAIGTDYFIHIKYDTSEKDLPSLVISKTNLQSGDNGYVLIGGFHYGHYRKTYMIEQAAEQTYYACPIPKGTDDTIYGENWQTNIGTGVIGNSVWTLLDRPICKDPTGMVKLNKNLWGDIYMSSGVDRYNGTTTVPDETVLQSKYNGTLYTCESSNATHPNWYGYVEEAARAGKRLPTIQEYVYAAIGTPDSSFKESNPDCMISVHNIHNLAGGPYAAWTTTMIDTELSTTYGWQAISADFMKGERYSYNIAAGQIYGPSNFTTSLRAIAGGIAGTSTNITGCRSLDTTMYPWKIYFSGVNHPACWCVCESV